MLDDKNRKDHTRKVESCSIRRQIFRLGALYCHVNKKDQTLSETKPNRACANCGMYYSRKFSVKRHTY